MRQYRFVNDDSLNKELVSITEYNANGQPVFTHEINSDCATGKYYYSYKDTFLKTSIFVYPGGDSSIENYTYFTDLKGRVTKQIKLWCTNHKFDVNDLPRWRCRQDTALLNYTANTTTEISPAGIIITKTFYDRYRRAIKEYNAVRLATYSYSDSTTVQHRKIQMLTRPENRNLAEYTVKHVFKKDRFGRITEDHEYNNNDLSSWTTTQYLSRKKIETRISYPAIVGAQKVTWISIYE